MAEADAVRAAAPEGKPSPVRRGPRRLPALARYAIIVILGAALAGLTSYLLRTIGF
ncbi:MAG: hypothetical protein AB7P08_03380 [Burkholderiales bacterium]